AVQDVVGRGLYRDAVRLPDRRQLILTAAEPVPVPAPAMAGGEGSLALRCIGSRRHTDHQQRKIGRRAERALDLTKLIALQRTELLAVGVEEGDGQHSTPEA